MDDAKQQILERLQNANNILVTVSANPTVDQLSACIGLTILLNKMNKHATAVFSGKVPSTIEFLQPEDTLETNTDSLRDFIISLDKSKADKLRYKVEDEVVKIFITPYKSSITEKDLVFSQGDFNVDVVMALGVHEAQDLDNAITAHGRILHDAVVICVNTASNGGQLGTINWLDTTASGVSELVTSLSEGLDPELLDGQIATALLTGIVAQTEHFSNQKTTPSTMTASATLLAAGANQQLVSKELAQTAAPKAVAAPAAPSPAEQKEAVKESNDGELDVPHDPAEEAAERAEKAAKKQSAKPAAAKGAAKSKPVPEPAPAPETKEPDDQLEPEPQPGAAQEAVETPESNEEPAADPKPVEPTTDPDEKLALREKRIEPLPHDEPVSTAIAPTSPVPDTPQPVLSDESDDSLDALLRQGASEPAQPVAVELPQPNPQPGAPIIEVPPAPEAAGPAPVLAPPENKPKLVPMPAPQPPQEPTPAPLSMPAPEPAPIVPPAPAPTFSDPLQPAPTPDAASDDTLAGLEESTESPHVDAASEATDVDSARKAVEDALKTTADQQLEPLAAIGSVPVDLPIGHEAAPEQPPVPLVQPGPGMPPAPAQGTQIPGYLQTPSMAPAPDGNAASANMPPFEDLPSTPPPVDLNIAPPPQVIAPNGGPMPPQGSPPPIPPPMP